MSDRLYRSRDERMLAGVAGGLAEMWDVDPSLVRIIWALLVPLTGGIALLVYIVMAIVVPEDDPYRSTYAAGATPAPTQTPSAMPGTASAAEVPPTTTEPQAGWVPAADARTARAQARDARRAARRANRAQRGTGVAPILIGSLLVLLGVYFLVREYLPTIDWDYFWPIVLIGLGVVVLVLAIDREPRNDEAGPGGPGTSG